MREQTRLVFWLLAAMCALRLSLAAFGYGAPELLMASLGAPAESNPQMPYIVRVWAIRDIVLGLLVITSSRATLRPLLVACVAIDTTDIISALLAGAAGQFDFAQTLGLMSTAIAALLPECAALWLMSRNTLALNSRETPNA